MKSIRSHKTEVSADFTVRRPDGSIREIRQINPPPQPPDMCKIEVRDKAGKLSNMKEFPVKSFVENYSEKLYHAMITGQSTANFTDTAGAAQSEDYNRIQLEAADDNDNYGIWVGTGNTAVAVTDYTLAAKVAHGTGAGQLDYGANSYIATTTDGTDIVYKVYRTFTNSSSGAITIEEVGIVAYDQVHYYLILRDVEDANGSPLSIAVPVGQTATVTYTFTQTQASGFCKQYLELMESMNFDTAKNLKYVGGSGATYSFNARSNWIPGYIKILSPAGETTWGLVVGSADTALDSTDYELGTLIAHGTGSGQLSYALVANEDLSIDGSNVTFIYKRVLTNNSGNTIDIEETGVYAFGHSAHTKRFMIIRFLTGTISLPDNYSVTAEFTFKHTV